MHFDQYRTRYEAYRKMQKHVAKNRGNRYDLAMVESARRILESMPGPEKFTRDLLYKAIVSDKTPGQLEAALTTEEPIDMGDEQEVFLSLAELLWWHNGRPFYNLYPGIANAFDSLKLDVPCSAIRFPFPSIAIQMAQPKEAKAWISAILVSSFVNSDLNFLSEEGGAFTGRRLVVIIQAINAEGTVVDFTFGFSDADPEMLLSRHVAEAQVTDLARNVEKLGMEMTPEHCGQAIKRALGVAMLAEDSELIAPVVLGKDRARWRASSDEVRRKLEEKAQRTTKQVGFTVGEELEKQLNGASPHFRRPHLAWVWTGKGRTVPKLVLRSGAHGGPIFVNRKKLEEVPTGYYGKG